MVASNKNMAMRWALAGPVVVFGAWGAWGATGCSSSSNSPAANPPADAGMQVVDAAQTGDAGLGFPVPDCHSCSPTSTCGGVLSSPDAGLTYCTQTCEASTDCPSGTACISNFETPGLDSDCLRPCTSDTDCSGGFICRSDVTGGTSICWSPYPPPTTVTPDAGADTGTPADAGVDSATTDDAGSDASPATDAATDAATTDAGADAADGG